MKTQSLLIVFAFLLGCAMLIFGGLGKLGVVRSPFVAATGIACIVGLGLAFEMRRRVGLKAGPSRPGKRH